MAMYSFFDLKDKAKRYVRFEQDEIRALLLTISITAFIMSFGSWGAGKEFDFAIGLRNLFNAFLVSSLAIIVHLTAQKIAALQLGFTARYNFWQYGLIFGLIVCFLSNGKLYFLAAGAITLTMMEGHRLGFFRYGMNYYELSKVALAGPLANIILALFFKACISMGNPLIEKAMYINVWLAIFSLIPLPGADGLNILYGSRPLYVLVLGFIIGAAILIWRSSILVTLLGALGIGVLLLVIFFFAVEFPYEAGK